MIVKWKQVSALEFRALYEGRQFLLVWAPEQHNWEVWVEGLRTDRRFTSAVGAMEAVDAVLNKRIIELGTIVQAAQRSGSAGRIVRHANA